MIPPFVYLFWVELGVVWLGVAGHGGVRFGRARHGKGEGCGLAVIPPFFVYFVVDTMCQIS